MIVSDDDDVYLLCVCVFPAFLLHLSNELRNFHVCVDGHHLTLICCDVSWPSLTTCDVCPRTLWFRRRQKRNHSENWQQQCQGKSLHIVLCAATINHLTLILWVLQRRHNHWKHFYLRSELLLWASQIRIPFVCTKCNKKGLTFIRKTAWMNVVS